MYQRKTSTVNLKHSPSIKAMVDETGLEKVRERMRQIRPGPADYKPENYDKHMK